jgi:hypothetical protein
MGSANSNSNTFKNGLLSSAYKDYKSLKSTQEYERLEMLKDAKFNPYENFRLKLYNPVEEHTSPKSLKPFNEHLQDMLVNQEKISVPGVYTNNLYFSDS